MRLIGRSSGESRPDLDPASRVFGARAGSIPSAFAASPAYVFKEDASVLTACPGGSEYICTGKFPTPRGFAHASFIDARTAGQSDLRLIYRKVHRVIADASSELTSASPPSRHFRMAFHPEPEGSSSCRKADAFGPARACTQGKRLTRPSQSSDSGDPPPRGDRPSARQSLAPGKRPSRT